MAKNFNLYAILGFKGEDFERGLNKARTQLISFSNNVKGTTSGISGAFKNLGGLGGMLKFAGIAGGLAIIGNEFRKAIQYSIQFEKALSNLKALTGASSADMKYYKQAASELGNQFGKTGVEMAETFKIVGSGKAELLKNKEGLVAVSAAAITLSKAAGMEVPEAADALVVAMNQFNAPATQANRYINALAAGAKEGAAEIPNLSASLTKFGSVANALKIPVEQSIALIEALSEKGLKDEVAGTGIKTFLLRLEQGAKSTRPSVVGLGQALDNLKEKNLSVNQAQQMFGMEAANVALALIAQTDRVKQLTTAVAGTSEAFTQAGINGDNVGGALERLSAKWTNTKEALLNGQGALSQFLKGLLNDLNNVLDGFSSILKSKEQLQGEKLDRANKLEVESYAKYWEKDGSLANLKQDLDSFNQYKQGWEKRLSEAKKRSDDAEIQKANSKISLYKQLIGLANEELNARTGRKKKPLVSTSDDTGATKKTPLQEYNDERKYTKKLYDERLIGEEEYIKLKESNLEAYLKSLAKVGKTDSKAFDEWSKLVRDRTIADNAGDVKPSFSAVSKGDFDNELDVGDVELPIPAVIKTDDEKIEEAYAQLQAKLHPLELELAIRGANNLFDSIGSIQTLGNAFSALKEKQDEGAATFFDYVNVMQQSFSAITGIYDGIASLIAIIESFDAAKKVSAGVSAATAATEVAANAAKSASNIAAATTSVAASTAEGTAGSIASALKSIPFPWNLIAAVGAGAAATALFSGLLKFESGGIVPGSSFSGDSIIARVNSGEMILNGSQQANLFNMINSGTASKSSSGEVTFKIRGEELVGVLNNTSARKLRMR